MGDLFTKYKNHPQLKRQASLIDDPKWRVKNKVGSLGSFNFHGEAKLLVATLCILFRDHRYDLVFHIRAQAQTTRPLNP